MKYIFFIASFNAFFFLVLLLQKESKQLHHRILIFWLLYLGLSTALYALTINLLPTAHFLSSGIIALFLLHGPFLHLYVTALTSNQKSFRTRDIGHFIPFMSFILYLMIAFNFPTYSEGIRVDHVAKGTAEHPYLFVFFLIITALSGPVYFFLAYRKYRESKKPSPDFSGREVDFTWLGKLIPIFGVAWTVLIIIAIIHHIFQLFSMAFCTDGLFLTLSIFIILIGYFGLKQKNVLIDYPIETNNRRDNEPEIKYAATKMEGPQLQQCCNKVEHYMETQKPYLDSDLSLPKLAVGLKLSTHHISQVINEVHGKNFFNFINKYRVEEVKRKIQDPNFQNYSLLGIAYESGFNSKSAFNRVFKNITGTTPSEFRRTQHAS